MAPKEKENITPDVAGKRLQAQLDVLCPNLKVFVCNCKPLASGRPMLFRSECEHGALFYHIYNVQPFATSHLDSSPIPLYPPVLTCCSYHFQLSACAQPTPHPRGYPVNRDEMEQLCEDESQRDRLQQVCKCKSAPLEAASCRLSAYPARVILSRQDCVK
jgi:hypothetical protein